MGVPAEGQTAHFVPIVGLDALVGMLRAMGISGLREKEDRC